MEDNDIFHLFYHKLDTKHLLCQVSFLKNLTKQSYQNTPSQNLLVLSRKNLKIKRSCWIETQKLNLKSKFFFKLIKLIMTEVLIK